MESFICKPDVRTLSAIEGHAKMKFLLPTSTRHISGTIVSITVSFALKSSATYLFYGDFL